MVFSSLVFIFVFLPMFLLVYFIFPSRRYRNLILLAASVFFYAWGEPLYVFMMIASVMVNYFGAIMIEHFRDKPNRSKIAFIATLVFNISILGFFKYSDFIIENLNSIFNINMLMLNIPLPIGISFFTFQILSYVIDVYWGNVKVQRNPMYLGAYISAFPQLIAGPIVRYETIEHELENRKENISDFSSGTRRFIIGLGKKVIIANNVAVICDSIIVQSPEYYGMLGAWVAIIAYTLQIYFDFSGYSDMAIGMGRMIGFHFLENFNYPYIAKSVTDFWRRWHMSLSTFFRDYVYIPLGGNRVSKGKWIRNIIIVWLLTGLWHGASWNYILWGLFYGIMLLLERTLLTNFLERIPTFLQHLYTLIVVILGWVIFRFEDISLIPGFLASLLGRNGPGTLNILIYTQVLQFKYILAFALGIVFSTPIFKNIYRKYNENAVVSVLSDLGLLIVLLLSINLLVIGTYNPFIYFKF